jgi:hypothetical protein
MNNIVIQNQVLDDHQLNCILLELSMGPLYQFSNSIAVDLRNQKGLYSIWRAGEFEYIGKAPISIGDRLASHRRGSRSGDEFNVLVSDRRLLMNLTQGQIFSISNGVLKFTSLIKNYNQLNYSYRGVIFNFLDNITPGPILSTIETFIKRNGLPGFGIPALNGINP